MADEGRCDSVMCGADRGREGWVLHMLRPRRPAAPGLPPAMNFTKASAMERMRVKESAAIEMLWDWRQPCGRCVRSLHFFHFQRRDTAISPPLSRHSLVALVCQNELAFGTTAQT
jgi:hypothetical protein